MSKNIGELVRKAENDYISGTTLLSKYVQHSMSETLDRIDAYDNSKHISGDTDSLGREKPFFNIVTAAKNVWFRATDIDRSNIKIRSTKSKDWIDSFLATIHIQDWMRRERFSSFLNEWGRVLAKYGSAVIKFVRNKNGLSISVVPWSTLIVDAIDFDANAKIEILELTEAQLVGRIKTHGYNSEIVKEIIKATRQRETKEKQKKDTKTGYIKLYEIHGNLERSYITGKEEDDDTFEQQMHVISFIGKKNGRITEYNDYTLFSGFEEKDPYMITHLIKEDGRTLAIGSIENIFESQWMVNHSKKQVKDALDLANKVIFQTSDQQFVGRNVLSSIETGDILIHSSNQPLTLINNQALNVVSAENFAVSWKSLGNEINGISEAMLGVTPKSGTAWHQTEAVLQESHSLFEIMTENKGLHLEDMFREWIIPYVKTLMNNSDEIAATLEAHDIERIDSIYLKNASIMHANNVITDKILNGQLPQPGEQQAIMQDFKQTTQDTLSQFGNQRFFKPSDIDDKTWKEQFRDLEWELEIDVTGEQTNTQEALTTLNTALKLIMTPGFEQNKKAQIIVGKVLEMTGAMSPVEYNAIPSEPQQPQAMTPGTSTGDLSGLITGNK